MASVQFRNVDKIYPGDAHIVKKFNLDIKDGEFIVFLGPSGCGKSTTLRMLSGLEEISGGEVLIGDKVVNDLNPKERNIAMVFQSYALYPHMTVYDNIAFSLKMAGQSKADIERQVRSVADMLQLTPLLERKPKALSGGQRQRVAMGRAMVRSPDVFLFDEPLSNLDAKLRNVMRGEIKTMQKKQNQTTVYVTHDQVEAMTLADRIVILRDGIIEQVGTPEEIYHHPQNKFVAGFIGSPTMNLLSAELKTEDDVLHIDLFGQSITLRKELKSYACSGEVTLGIRPSDLYLSDDLIENCSKIEVTVERCEYMGATMLVHAIIGGQSLVIESDSSKNVQPDDVISVYIDTAHLHLFDSVTDEAIC